jgi:phosphoribosylcarboxyaminoimidazole (NCAIR) mutase
MRRHLLEAFATKLSKEDVVVIEATGNAASVAAVIAPDVRKVVIANPKQGARHRSCEDHMWTAPPARGLSIALATWSGAVICPARSCGAHGRWP